MRKTLGALAGAIALTAAAVLPAHADTLTNTLDNSVDNAAEVKTVNQNSGPATVGFKLLSAYDATIPTDPNGCNASNSTPVTVSFSGITAAPITFNSCGTEVFASFPTTAAGNFNVTATASGGRNGSLYNSAPAAFTLVVQTVDTTAPVITPSVIGTTGSNGWYTSDVSVSWTVSDAESAVTSQSGCVPQTVVADTIGTTFTCSATSAGGSTSQSVTVKRDATAPVVNLTAPSGTYVYGDPIPAASCTASDATSGVAGSCAVSGFSTAVGTHTVTGSATDNAGNTGTDSRTYTVAPWTLSGFYAPVDMGGVVNVVRGGSTVPVKFEVFKGAAELTDPAATVQSFTATTVACETGLPSDDIEFTTTGGTSLRYDATAGQFIQNWQTPKKPGTCYSVKMTTTDGSALTALFKLK